MTNGTILYDLEESLYHARPELSSTGAKRILNSPKTFHHWQTHPQPFKKVFDVGTAAHSKVLGVGAGVVEIPVELLASNGAASTAAAKEFMAKTRAGGGIPMKLAEITEVNAITEAVLAHPEARKYLEAAGDPEVSVFSTDPDSEVDLRCRFDYLHDDHRLALDLKTTTDTTLIEFENTIVRLGYDVSWGHYTDTMRYATGTDVEMCFVAVEKEPPYEVGVFFLSEDFKHMGRQKARKARARFKACMDAGLWPMRSPEAQFAAPPTWAVARFQEDYE